MTQWGYRPRAPVDPRELADKTRRESWMVGKWLKAFSFANASSPIGEIDLVIEMPIPYEQLKSRAIFINVEKIEIPVIALDDLIRVKKESGRQQDLRDLDNLEIIRGG